MINYTNFPFQLLAVAQVEASAKLPPLSREDHEAWVVEYVLSGQGDLRIGGAEFHLRAGDVYFLPKHSAHWYCQDRFDPWTKLFIVVDGDFVEFLIDMYELRELYVLRKASGMLHYFEELELLSRNCRDGNGQAAVIFHQFIEECARREQLAAVSAPAEVLALKLELDSHIEKRFSLAEYAAEAGFSREHLSRRFRLAFQESPEKYLLNRKIELARNLLQYSHLSVKEIACRLQFSDQYYFSNYFKRKTGYSPSDLRKNKGFF